MADTSDLPADNGDNRNAVMLGVRALNGILAKLGTIFPQTIGTSTTATGGAATLPANPVGFLTIVNPTTGATVKVAYYAE